MSFLLFNAAYTTSDGFRLRMKSLQHVYASYALNVSFENKNAVQRNHSIDGSTFVLFNNLFVAYNNLVRHPPYVGTGLGSHKRAYERYSLTRRFEQFFNITELNYQDANSLGIRLLSEFGLVGVFFSFLLLFGCFVRRNDLNAAEPYWVISGAILTFLVVTYIRKGHYFHYGLTMYMMLYYFNSKNHKQFKKEEKRKKEEERKKKLQAKQSFA